MQLFPKEMNKSKVMEDENLDLYLEAQVKKQVTRN